MQPFNRPKAKVTAATGPGRQKRSILLADDDRAVREALELVLTAEGYEVFPAKDGREAIATFLERRADLVLLDVTMPGRNGWQVLETISNQNPLVPVVVITARPHQFEQALIRGVDAIMEKPLHIQTLLDAISDLLAQTEADRCHRLGDPNFRTRLLGAFVNPPLA